jgi:hypothetical protein
LPAIPTPAPAGAVAPAPLAGAGDDDDEDGGVVVDGVLVAGGKTLPPAFGCWLLALSFEAHAPTPRTHDAITGIQI